MNMEYTYIYLKRFITIQHACSLGTSCMSSNLIKNNALKLESYPFDWIFSNTKHIAHMIEDDFKTFLNRDLYSANDIHLKNCSHTYYGPSIFNHHNPKYSEEDYNYFKRCVDRFKKLLCSTNNKLFIVYFNNKTTDEVDSIQREIIDLNACLQRYTCNFYICAIINIVGTRRYHTFTTHENIDFCILHTTSVSDGNMFHNDEDDTRYIHALIKNKYTFDVKPL